MIAAIRSALFALIFYLGTIPFVLAALAATLFGRDALASVARTWAGFHHFCTRRLVGIRLRIEGEVPRGAVLVAARHEAMYETLELFRLLRDPVIMAKRELTQIPGWGRVARTYGVIPVDRAASASALRAMLRAAEGAKAAGRPILIFPEGTRVAHGQEAPLRPGFAGLYTQLGLPVVPVALDSGRLWPKGFVKRAGTVTFRFGAPIAPGLPRREAEARVHAAINALNG
ncbi:MAG: 1-acyl-sn-glycerol-3-phosphate acyltransferase [Sphingomonadaceae bacterium]|nr:1-acyl-sn-glycerol-3-phosphate acyltransferase [Sphingomonadaceae bacterium]